MARGTQHVYLHFVFTYQLYDLDLEIKWTTDIQREHNIDLVP